EEIRVEEAAARGEDPVDLTVEATDVGIAVRRLHVRHHVQRLVFEGQPLRIPDVELEVRTRVRPPAKLDGDGGEAHPRDSAWSEEPVDDVRGAPPPTSDVQDATTGQVDLADELEDELDRVLVQVVLGE